MPLSQKQKKRTCPLHHTALQETCQCSILVPALMIYQAQPHDLIIRFLYIGIYPEQDTSTHLLNRFISKFLHMETVCDTAGGRKTDTGNLFHIGRHVKGDFPYLEATTGEFGQDGSAQKDRSIIWSEKVKFSSKPICLSNHSNISSLFLKYNIG